MYLTVDKFVFKKKKKTVDKFKLKNYIKLKKKNKSLIGQEASCYYHLFEKTVRVVMCNVIINLGFFFSSQILFNV